MDDPDSDRDVSQLAREVVAELDPGTTIGAKVILSRRQLIAIAGGGLSLGALATFGASDAEAAAVGQVGTSSDRIDVYGYSVDASNEIVDASGTSHTGELADVTDLDSVSSTSTASGYDLTVNGDTYEFNE